MNKNIFYKWDTDTQENFGKEYALPIFNNQMTFGYIFPLR